MPIMNQNNTQYRPSPYDKQHHQQEEEEQQQQQQQQQIPKKQTFIDDNKDDSLDTDPSVYQLLQTAIQLIYQTRSTSTGHINNNSNISNSNNANGGTPPDVFNIKGFEGGLFQSKTLNANDLGELIDKDIHLEYVEINEINRDLTLWCEHILSSPLKIDIFLCIYNPITNEFKHSLLERWMFTFTPIDFSQQFNRNLLISSSSTPIITNNNTVNTPSTINTTPVKSQINNMVPLFNLSPLSPPGNSPQPYYANNNSNSNNSSNNNNDLHSSMLIKSLYYVLSSMPLFQSLKKQQQMGPSTIVPPLPKIKYGVSQNFPPPFNYKPEEYPHLVKLNFPIHETSKGSISLTVQFPNTPMTIIDGSTSSLVIYPSRSCSSNLVCHNSITNNSSITSASTNNDNLPSLASLIQQKSNKQKSHIPPSPLSLSSMLSNDNNNNSSPSSPSKKSQSTSPSSAPISIPTLKSTPSPPSLNTSGGITVSTNITTTSKIAIDINNVNSDVNSKHENSNYNQYPQQQQPFQPQLTPQFSPVHFKSFPYSPTSPPLHSFSLLNSPSKNYSGNNTISPPSSPYRIGHRRTLFFDGLSPSSLNGNISSGSTGSFSSFLSSPGGGGGNKFNRSTNDSYSHSNYSTGMMSFGSFQESILTGNMLNTPSTKFDGYLADLGVSGKDYIPPHKKIPFSSLYYHIDHDTPYVADIDIGEKGFRVPPKGLIQLTLFNPFNTPIKTFLLNFDLSDMGSDTKTFIRQKIVSFNNSNNSGNTDNSNNSNNSLATSLGSLNISKSNSNDNLIVNNNNNNNQNILKYAIHLRFICVKKRKYYLYKNIRVVFPNRVPDDMEKLKIIYEYPPDPKYFPFCNNK